MKERILSPKTPRTRNGYPNRNVKNPHRSLTPTSFDETEVDSADPEDLLGLEITRILNENSTFEFNFQDNDDNISMKPLLSKENWPLVKSFFMELFSEPKTNIQSALQNLQNFLFWNTKSSEILRRLFIGLTVISLFVSTATITISTYWYLQMMFFFGSVLFATLVDLHELKQGMPKLVQDLYTWSQKNLTWIDQYVLHGITYKGRGWNKDDFEWDNHKVAQSNYRSLWTLPPPSALEKQKLSCDETEMTRDDWSIDTTKHAVGINFCYNMLQEANVRKKYSKLRRAVLSNKEKLGPIVSTSEQNGETIAYTSQMNELEDGEAVTIVETDIYRPMDLIVSTSMKDTPKSMATPQTKSPTDAIEVMRQREHFFLKTDATIPEVRSDETMPDSIVNDIMKDDYSFTQTSQCTQRDGPESNSDVGTDMKWIDVGATIGVKLLGSAAVQKAMTSHDTAEKISVIRRNFGSKPENEAEDQHPEPSQGQPPKKKIAEPVHPMWTSASAAATINPILSNLSSDASVNSMTIEFNDSPSVHTESIEKKSSFASVGADVSRHRLGSDSAVVESSMRTISMQNVESGSRKSKLTLQVPEKEVTGSLNRKIHSIPRTPKTPRTPRTPRTKRLPKLLPGVKIVVPLVPVQPGYAPPTQSSHLAYQMATVVSSKRLYVGAIKRMPSSGMMETNCLSVTVKLDKSFLRMGEFAEMTFRVMDEWGSRYVPKHSKLPLGSCVSTSFGLGVLVGWRVEDDIHIVQSLWQQRGAYAYLNRDSIHATAEASVGLDVKTAHGHGKVVAYKNGGRDFRSGYYFVAYSDENSRYNGQTIELDRSEIMSCPSAQFIPVLEHIREAAKYRLQLYDYNESLEDSDTEINKSWENLARWSDMLWTSFLKVVEEDDDFDEGVDEIITSAVKFLDKLDSTNDEDNDIVPIITRSSTFASDVDDSDEANWLVYDVFGLFGEEATEIVSTSAESIEIELVPDSEGAGIRKTYARAFAVIQTLMKTVKVTQATCANEPDFKLALSILYEFLLFVKTVLKVQQKNTNPHSIKVWKRAMEEIASTFGPGMDRVEKVVRGIAERMESQGNKAKVRLLRFVDLVIQDDILFMSIEQRDWTRFGEHFEAAIVEARIADEESVAHYHKTAVFLLDHFATVSSKSGSAGARNNEKFEYLVRGIQCLASPKRSVLKLFLQENVLELIERILVRTFQDEEGASQMLSIHASNFNTLRRFRMLQDFTVAGKFWIPLLHAADAELSWFVSQMPETTQDYLEPLSRLVSLCIVDVHKINNGDLTRDWLDFLMEEEAVGIIHELDMKLILALESFSRDVKEMLYVLPYYPSIEDDILNLIDEVDIKAFLREASDALDDPDALSAFVLEKSTTAIERFLDYLPKMSIPVERRELVDGWVLTCRGEGGGDLTLTDLVVRRENLVCQVLGGDTLFFPMIVDENADDDCLSKVSAASSHASNAPENIVESSILDQIRDLILRAKRDGCWKVGVGGVESPPSDPHVASMLQNLPVSTVLNCALNLWRNLELDDDELMEIAIKDVSYQIRLNQNGKEEKDQEPNDESVDESSSASSHQHQLQPPTKTKTSHSFLNRYNPRVDPTVLYLEIKMVTFHLDNFFFRIEKDEHKRTLFDPTFEGSGSLMVKNVSIKIRVDCLKQSVRLFGSQSFVPMLELRELDVELERVRLKVKDTGADWILNRVVKSFEDSITEVVASNLKDQVKEQVNVALESMNSYFKVNPDIILGLLGISIEDLDEKIVYV